MFLRHIVIGVTTARGRWIVMIGLAAVGGCSGNGGDGGAGPYSRIVRLERRGETSANVSVGDVNGDGHLDILLVKGRHWPLVDYLLLGDGAGEFQPARPLREDADRSYSGVLADLDADGDLDVVVSNDRPDSNVIYLNDGRGTFAVHGTFGDSDWPTRYVSVVDLNGDAQADIVVANRYGQREGGNYICFNQGAARFDGACVRFSVESATTITPADVNGDGRLDLIVPHRDGGQGHIYLNDATHSFGERVPFGPPDANVRSAEAGDVNGDGTLDLIVIDERAGPGVLLGHADTGFADPVPLGPMDRRPYALRLADLDRDGNVDVIVGYVGDRPIAFFGDGAGNFTPTPFGDDEGAAYGFATGDVDEDGFVDIAMARSDAPNVLYFGGPASPPAR